MEILSEVFKVLNDSFTGIFDVSINVELFWIFKTLLDDGLISTITIIKYKKILILKLKYLIKTEIC